MKPQSHKLDEAVRNSSSLAGVTAVLWLALAGPLYWWQGTAGLEGLSYAALLCLLPGCLVFVLSASFVAPGRPATEIMIPLVATVLRLVVVLVGVLLIREFRPEAGIGGFLAWVIVFYFAMLWAETRILLKKKPSSPPAS